MKERDTRSELENFLFQLERMREQGFDLGQLPNEAFEKLIELIDREDERKLNRLRQELQSDFLPNEQ